jgi:hypothetical protein
MELQKVFFIKGHGPNPPSTLKLAHQAGALPGPAVAHWPAQPPCSISVETAAPLLAVPKHPATAPPWPSVREDAAVPISAALRMSCPPWTPPQP